MILLWNKIIYSTILKECVSIFSIYCFWCFIHGVSTEYFYSFCNPKHIMQYLLIPFYNETPHCKILYWLQQQSRTSIQSISYTLITWISKVLLEKCIIRKKSNDKKEDING